MESIADLLPLLLAALYFLLRLRKPRRAQPPQPAEDTARQGELRQGPPRTLEEWIRRMEQAAQDAARDADPLADDGIEVVDAEPTRTEPARAEPAPGRPRTRPSEAAPASGSFRAAGGFEHDEHGFGAENPLSEERLESAALRRSAPRKDYDPHGFGRTEPAARTAGQASLGTRLRQPGALQQAFVLKEVLGPPRSRR